MSPKDKEKAQAEIAVAKINAKQAIIVALISVLGTAILTLVPTLIKIDRLQSQVTKGLGEFEWQWAGAPWIGTVEITGNSAGKAVAKVNVRRYCGGKEVGPAIESNGTGTTDIGQNSLGLELPVWVYHYKEDCSSNGRSGQVLRGTLPQVEAYAGIVHYEDQFGSSRGDMILVKYASGIRSAQ